MNKATDIEKNMLIIALSIEIMFDYLLGSFGSYLLIFSILLLVKMNGGSLLLHSRDIYWGLYILFQILVCLFYRVNVLVDVKRILLLCLCVFLAICLQESKLDYETGTMNLLLFFGFIQMASVIVQTFAPDLVRQLETVMFSQEVMQSLYRDSVFYRSGIINQAGIAGFNISVYTSVAVINVFRKETKRNMLFVVLGIVGVLLTGKRMLFALTSICTLISFYLYFRFIHKRTNIVYKIGLFLIVFSVTVISIPEFQQNIVRIISNHSLQGREVIYPVVIEHIKENPFFGTGVREYETSIGRTQAHNEYLGVIANVGLFGLIVFLLAVFIPLIECSKIVFRHGRNIYQMGNRDQKVQLIYVIGAVCFQLIFLTYAITGNPFCERAQMITYFLFSSIGLKNANKIRLFYKYSSEDSRRD